MNNNDFSSIIGQLNSFQSSLQKYQNAMAAEKQQETISPATDVRYPVNTQNPKTVEDVLAVPTYFENLKADFYKSETGKRLREQEDVEFLMFAEKVTHFPSETLEAYRAKVAEQNETRYPVAPTTKDTKKEKPGKNQVETADVVQEEVKPFSSQK